MHRCAISFGANLGNPALTIRNAARMILDQLQPTACQQSQLYRTPAVGGPQGQADFLNAVMTMELNDNVLSVAQTLRDVEYRLGRQRQERWEARVIDLDVLLFDQLRLRSDRMQIPHPRMCLRSFILRPACDVAADWIEPVTGKTICQLTEHLRIESDPICLLASTEPWRKQLENSLSRLGFDRGATASIFGNQRFRIGQTEVELAVCSHPQDVAKIASNRFHSIIVSLEEADWKRAAARPGIGEWERSLGLIDDCPTGTLDGRPRYLIPPSRLEWAIHEIVANIQAMKSFVEPSGQWLW